MLAEQSEDPCRMSSMPSCAAGWHSDEAADQQWNLFGCYAVAHMPFGAGRC